MRRNDALFLDLVNLGILKVWIWVVGGVVFSLIVASLGTAWKESSLCGIGVSNLPLDTNCDWIFSVHLICFLFS